MSDSRQNYRNHAKFVPMYHYVLAFILVANVVATAYYAVRDPDVPHVWAVVMAVAVIMIALFARAFALKAQDRVIRLEERLRMRELLPADLTGRIHEFTADQLIALRFASDAELPTLAATVLRDNVQTRDAIKRMVKHWRADDHRL